VIAPAQRLDRDRALAALSSARTIGIVGIALGVLACWLALPPVLLRSVLFPVLLGLIGIAGGIWAFARGDRRIGTGAVLAGVLAIAVASLVINAQTSNLKVVFVWSALIAATLRYATPLTFAAIGGLFSERSGVVNIGLEGMMLMGAYFGVYGADATGSWVGGILIGMGSGGLLALVHAFFCITLRADQIVIGTAINFLALGITGYLYNDHYGDTGTPNDLPSIPDVHLHWLREIPPHGLGDFLEGAFGSLNLMVWLSLLLVPIASVFLFRTALGLRLRSVGEHPRAADTVGIPVYLVRYSAVTLSGMLAALGGVYLSLGFVNSFTENMTAGRGFIALAAVIFGNWRPYGALSAALLFGFSSALAQRLPDLSTSESAAWPVLFQTLPYVLTLVAVAGLIGRTIPPAAVGRPYKKQ
jgi:general nucleoside transport system permease protein